MGDFDCELDFFALQVIENFFLEESGIHTDFDFDSGHLLPDLGHAILDDVQCSALGIMNIAGAISNLKKVAGLSDMAKKREVTFRVSILRVIPAKGPLNFISAGEHGSIEVQGDG